MAWGTTHKEGARQVPVIAADAPPERAKELGKKCRDLGLEPLMMFSMVYPEAPEALDVIEGADPAGGGGGPAACADVRPHQGAAIASSGSSASSSSARWHATTA